MAQYQKRRKIAEPVPTLDEYFRAVQALANLVRKRLNGQRVTRGQMREALEEFERVEYGAF